MILSMETILLALIQQLNGAVFTLIAILLVSFWLLFKSGGWVKSYGDFEKKSEKFDTKIDTIKDSLSSIKATTDLLYQAHLSTVQAHSPVSLTDRGKEISAAISAELKVNNHWEEIKQAVENKKPTNPYDIQTVSMDIARNCFEKIFTLTEQNEIKTYAFGIGLNLLEIYPILGVIIRDRIFKEKDIKTEEVDRYTPAVPKAG